MIRVISYPGACQMVRDDREFFNLAPCPADEPATQCGDHYSDGIMECEIYIKQLIRAFGEPPAGTEFFIMKNLHDFGIYHDVAIFFNPEDDDSQHYAWNVEEGLDHWDEQAKVELIEREHHLYVAKVIPIQKTA